MNAWTSGSQLGTRWPLERDFFSQLGGKIAYNGETSSWMMIYIGEDAGTTWVEKRRTETGDAENHLLDKIYANQCHDRHKLDMDRKTGRTTGGGRGDSDTEGGKEL